MLKQFTLYKQCPTPTHSNVFLPTCSATAFSDSLTALEASSQYLTATDNPLMAKIIQIQFEANKAERDNLVAALDAVNNPWYKVGKSARKFMANLMGWEDKIDSDLLLAEEISENLSELDHLMKKFTELYMDIHSHDVPDIREAYLDGVIDLTPLENSDYVERISKFEYTEGRTIDLVPPDLKQKVSRQKSSQHAAEDEPNSFNDIQNQRSKSSYRL